MLRFRTIVHGMLGKCKYTGKLARKEDESIAAHVLKVVESPGRLCRSTASKVASRASVIMDGVGIMIRLTTTRGVCSPRYLSVSLPGPLNDLDKILDRRPIISTVEPRFGMRD